MYQKEDIINKIIINQGNKYFGYIHDPYYIIIKSDEKIYFVHKDEELKNESWTIEEVLYRLNKGRWVLADKENNVLAQSKNETNQCTCSSWDLFHKGCICGGL